MPPRAGIAGAGPHPNLRLPEPAVALHVARPAQPREPCAGAQGRQAAFAGSIRTWREEGLGLPARARHSPASSGTLYAFSPHVVPILPDWGEGVRVTGYWFLDNPDWRPPEALAAFLASGEPPVYCGFGSMPGLDPRHMTAIVVEALAKIGRRGLLARGGGALAAETLPQHVHLLDDAPHDRLLPFVSAAIHHGGAGTTAASLRAGKPCAICPFFGDQPFWARRVAELGVGPAPLDRRTLSAERLAAAIVAMGADPMRQRAQLLGDLICGEAGVTAAAGFIEERLPKKSLGRG